MDNTVVSMHQLESEDTQCEIKNASELPFCMGVMDVAKAMGIGRNVALNLVHSEGFPKIRVGRRLIIPKESFLNWLNSKAIEAI